MKRNLNVQRIALAGLTLAVVVAIGLHVRELPVRAQTAGAANTAAAQQGASRAMQTQPPARYLSFDNAIFIWI